MNLHDPKHPWARLTAAARTVTDRRDTAAPYGFATRLSAIAFTQERTMASLLERFALRAVGVACLLTMTTIATNYSVVTNLFADREETPLTTSDDPVGEIIDVASS